MFRRRRGSESQPGQDRGEDDDPGADAVAQTDDPGSDLAKGAALLVSNQSRSQEIGMSRVVTPSAKPCPRMSSGMATRKRMWMPKCRSSGSSTPPVIARPLNKAQAMIGSQARSAKNKLSGPSPNPVRESIRDGAATETAGRHESGRSQTPIRSWWLSSFCYESGAGNVCRRVHGQGHRTRFQISSSIRLPRLIGSASRHGLPSGPDNSAGLQPLCHRTFRNAL